MCCLKKKKILKNLTETQRKLHYYQTFTLYTTSGSVVNCWWGYEIYGGWYWFATKTVFPQYTALILPDKQNWSFYNKHIIIPIAGREYMDYRLILVGTREIVNNRYYLDVITSYRYIYKTDANPLVILVMEMADYKQDTPHWLHTKS